MQDLLEQIIVLGQFPGIGAQISFAAWLLAVSAGGACTALWLFRRLLRFKNWIVTTFILMQTRRRVRA